MLKRYIPSRKKIALSFLALGLSAAPAAAQNGVLFTGAGPVNRSMGGAATAAPLDASGALFWNPATISGLPSSSIDFGVEMLLPQTRLSSSLPPNAFGPGIPNVGLSGSTNGNDGAFAIPTMALVYRPEDSLTTYGLGVFTVGGFGVNYPASGVNPPVNPILTAQPPNGFGLGSLFSNFQAIEITPNASVQITDRLAVGGGPTLTMANLRVDPLFLAAPNRNGQYPPGAHSLTSWGGGFQIGAYYTLENCWRLGASYKSTQWMEAFHFSTAESNGTPRSVNYTFNIPSIVSIGVGYAGFDRWTLAADCRYVDYGQTEGFQQSGFAPNGAVRGLGWRSVFATAIGAQYQMSDALSLRFGYSYNENPIADAQSSFNVASPTILQHAIYCGASYHVTEALSLSVAYVHCFENSIEGPYATPFGPAPGGSVRNTTSADTFVLGATVKFGGRSNSQ